MKSKKKKKLSPFFTSNKDARPGRLSGKCPFKGSAIEALLLGKHPELEIKVNFKTKTILRRKNT